MGPTDLPSGRYNAAQDLLTRNLPARAGKAAFIDAHGAHSYAEVAERAGRVGAALLALGLAPGDRVALALLDGVDFVTAFLGAMRVGLVPIPLNTLMPASDFAYVLGDSGARIALVSEPLAATLEQAIGEAAWPGRMFVAREGAGLAELVALASGEAAPHDSAAEDIAFWIYSSGSTGRPKGAQHRHASLPATAELFSRQVLGVAHDDVLFSAGKLFFAYGLGNSLTFPMYAGATAVLFPGRVTPDVAVELLARHGVTIFCGAPTLFASMLASGLAGVPSPALRLCTSAGEGLPAEVGHAWTRATGVEIVDGIGSTEMLHIFLTNRPGDVRYGATGRPAPGYEVRLVGDDGAEAAPGDLGELWVRGPSMTAGYWNQPEKNAATFVDGWMRTGDKFGRDPDGCYVHHGRMDDMLKVSGLWVSPGEVEAALTAHEAVVEAAVIGVPDAVGLVKVKAYVVPRTGAQAGPELAEDLKQFVRARLLPHKYPRLIEFIDALPRTATGKIRRHVLREWAAGGATST
jgi:benzoate-CoA ligase